MELDELKEAISNIKEFYGDALYSKDAGVVTKAVQELLSLASSVIAVSGILPKKLEPEKETGQPREKLEKKWFNGSVDWKNFVLEL